MEKRKIVRGIILAVCDTGQDVWNAELQGLSVQEVWSELVLVQSLVLLIITLVLHIKIRQPDHKGIMRFPWEAVLVLR